MKALEKPKYRKLSQERTWQPPTPQSHEEAREMQLRANIKLAKDVATLSLWLSIIAISVAIFSLTQ